MREIFEHAAQIIAEGGHCKGRLGDTLGAEGEHCAVGALMVARYLAGTPDDYRSTCIAADFTHDRYGLGLVDYNNAPETTGEDIILLFKELAHDQAGRPA